MKIFDWAMVSGIVFLAASFMLVGHFIPVQLLVIVWIFVGSLCLLVCITDFILWLKRPDQQLSHDET